jgi:hypothetical protein
MPLAHHLEELVVSGAVKDYAELARLGHVSLARITQIMNLLLLAPEIQEEILFLSKTTNGHDPIKLRYLQAVALERDWGRQRERFRSIMALCHNRTRDLDPEDRDARCK